MHRKPDGCVKPMPNATDKVPAKQGGGSEGNPTYSTPTAKMPVRMR